MGFFRIYSFPWTPDRNAVFLPLTEAEAAAKTGGSLPGFKPFADDTPEHKAANQAQGEDILRVVLDAAGDTVIVAEDLGVVPDYVRPTLDKLGIPGFRIPALFREADGARWIVDYKTSRHEGAGLDGFLDKELERYAPQLAAYARLLESARQGLYFPLLRGWRAVKS